MIRKQVYIDEDLDRALKTLARSTGRPEAEHVRAALRAYVSAALPERGKDPLLDLIGLVDAPDVPVDLADNHDRYLYTLPKAPRKRRR